MIDQVPGNANCEDVNYEVAVRRSIERGLADLKADCSFTSEEQANIRNPERLSVFSTVGSLGRSICLPEKPKSSWPVLLAMDDT